MSSPMFDLPDHLLIGVNKDGDGPVQPHEEGFDRWTCWCGRQDCTILSE